MLRYRTIRRYVELRNLALIPADVALSGSIWKILAWACDDIKAFDPVPMARIKTIFREWERDCGIDVGKIASIQRLIEKHSDAVEFDLIKLGLRLRDCPSESFNWRDLWVIVTNAPQDSSTFSAVNTDAAGWTKTNMLLADIADATSWLVWAKTKAASKGGTPPDRIPRPGVKRNLPRDGSKVKPAPLQRIREVYGITKKEDPSWGRKLSALFS